LIQAQRAQLASAQWRQAQTHQHAPVSGTVFDLLYRPGERVPANAPVVALLPDNGLKLRFYVPQAALPQLQLGQTVTVHCDGCPAGLQAQVAFISPQAEYTPPVIYSNENRQKLVFLVEAKPIRNTAQQLKPGQPIDIHLRNL
jgi:HlyD family secretion protein